MKTVLCYGDSNTYGYDPRSGLRYPASVRWTCRLATLLGPDYHVIEEGCNGRTTVFDDPIEGWKNGLGYLKPCLNSHKPVDIVILMLGPEDHPCLPAGDRRGDRSFAFLWVILRERHRTVPGIAQMLPADRRTLRVSLRECRRAHSAIACGFASPGSGGSREAGGSADRDDSQHRIVKTT